MDLSDLFSSSKKCNICGKEFPAASAGAVSIGIVGKCNDCHLKGISEIPEDVQQANLKRSEDEDSEEDD